MKKIQWNAQLVTGIELVDAQHQVFIAKIDAFLDRCIMEGCDRKDLQRMFDFLMRYATTHFEDEELCMHTHAFPGLVQHREQHEQLTLWLQQTRQQWRNAAPGPDQVFKVSYFLYDWLTRHILEDDMAMARFIRKANSNA